MSLRDEHARGYMDTIESNHRFANSGNGERADVAIPWVVQEWIHQLAEDKMLHGIIELTQRENEQVDVEVTCLLRGSQGHAVMEPKITIRR